MARLKHFGLELAPDKTKTIRFGRGGGEYNGRFDFLGFEFRWELSRAGRLTQIHTDKSVANLNPYNGSGLVRQPQESVSIGVHLWFWSF
jgi:hypothetical protein